MLVRAQLLAIACVAACLTEAEAGPTGATFPPLSTRAALPVAVFGADDRAPLPARYGPLQEKIGVLFNIPSRTVCTAFCVADSIIATAGHCLYRTTGEKPPRLADFWFARNYDQVRDYARIAGYATGGAAQNVTAGSLQLKVRPPIDATSDWALVRLQRPICTGGGLAVQPMSTEEVIGEAQARRVFQLSYHRDFTNWRLAYSQPCAVARDFEQAQWKTISKDFSAPDHLLLHTCDTGGASSGSPLLVETKDGPKVIGINVGTYVQSKVLMQNGQVMQRLKADTVANTGVTSAAFAARLDAFRRAAILAGPMRIRELQERLRRRQLYDGAVDGNYGPALKSAIESYERASGLPVTGLATEGLLKRLGETALGSQAR